MIKSYEFKTKKMKTKTKKADVKKLYNLLSDAEVISDGERIFWLESFSDLSEKERIHLEDIIQDGEKELIQEKDAHQARIAEIDTKCVVRLQEVAKKNNLKVSSEGSSANTDYDYDEDSVIEALHEAGEI